MKYTYTVFVDPYGYYDVEIEAIDMDKLERELLQAKVSNADAFLQRLISNPALSSDDRKTLLSIKDKQSIATAYRQTLSYFQNTTLMMNTELVAQFQSLKSLDPQVATIYDLAQAMLFKTIIDFGKTLATDIQAKEKAKLEQVRKLAENARRNANAKQQQAQVKNAEVIRLQNELNNARAEYAKMEQARGNNAQELRAKQTEIVRLTGELQSTSQDARSQANSAKEQLELLQKQLQEQDETKTQTLAQLRNALNTKQAELSKLQKNSSQRITEKQTSLAASQTARQQAQTRLQQLQQLQHESQTQIRKAAREQAQTQMKQLQTEKQAHIRDVKAAQEQAQAHKSHLANLTTEKDRLQSQLQKSNNARVAAQTARTNAQTAVKQVQARLGQVESYKKKIGLLQQLRELEDNYSFESLVQDVSNWKKDEKNGIINGKLLGKIKTFTEDINKIHENHLSKIPEVETLLAGLNSIFTRTGNSVGLSIAANNKSFYECPVPINVNIDPNISAKGYGYLRACHIFQKMTKIINTMKKTITTID